MTSTFSRNDPRDQRLPVGLTADEYLFVRDQSHAEGLSQSALVVRLINEYRREVATKQLSVHERYENSVGAASIQHHQSDGNLATVVSIAVTAALSAYERVRKA